jgi:hypothetical protein
MSRQPTKYTYAGKSQSLGEWAEELGVHEATLRLRMKAKMTPEQVFTKGKLPKPTDGAANPKRRRAQPSVARPTRREQLTKKLAVEGMPSITVPSISPGKVRKLLKPIEPVDALTSDGRTVATPAAALASLGYRIVETIDTPRGLALIVEAP